LTKLYYTYTKIKQNTAVNNNIIVQIILNHESMEMETRNICWNLINFLLINKPSGICRQIGRKCD